MLKVKIKAEQENIKFNEVRIEELESKIKDQNHEEDEDINIMTETHSQEFHTITKHRHTKLPWTYHRDTIFSPDGNRVLTAKGLLYGGVPMGPEEDEANIKLIIDTMTTHDELLTIAKKLRAAIMLISNSDRMMDRMLELLPELCNTILKVEGHIS